MQHLLNLPLIFLDQNLKPRRQSHLDFCFQIEWDWKLGRKIFFYRHVVQMFIDIVSNRWSFRWRFKIMVVYGYFFESTL